MVVMEQKWKDGNICGEMRGFGVEEEIVLLVGRWIKKREEKRCLCEGGKKV